MGTLPKFPGTAPTLLGPPSEITATPPLSPHIRGHNATFHRLVPGHFSGIFLIMHAASFWVASDFHTYDSSNSLIVFCLFEQGRKVVHNLHHQKRGLRRRVLTRRFLANRLAGVLWGKMINNYWAHGPCRARRATFASDWSPESVGVWLFSSLARHGFPFVQWQLVTPQRLQLSRKRTSQSRAPLPQDILHRAKDIYQVEFGPGKAGAELALCSTLCVVRCLELWQQQLTAAVESATSLFSVHRIIRCLHGVGGQRPTRRVDIRGFCPLGAPPMIRKLESIFSAFSSFEFNQNRRSCERLSVDILCPSLFYHSSPYR